MNTRLPMILGPLIGALLVSLAIIAIAHADPGGDVDPVVVFDHADRSPPLVIDLHGPAFRPTRWAEFRARVDTFGANTGGAWIAAVAAIGIRRARARWPKLRRGWHDEVTATLFAASVWVAASLATGATWATAAIGVLMAAAAGTLIAMVPGEKLARGGVAGAGAAESDPGDEDVAA